MVRSSAAYQNVLLPWPALHISMHPDGGEGRRNLPHSERPEELFSPSACEGTPSSATLETACWAWQTRLAGLRSASMGQLLCLPAHTSEEGEAGHLGFHRIWGQFIIAVFIPRGQHEGGAVRQQEQALLMWKGSRTGCGRNAVGNEESARRWGQGGLRATPCTTTGHRGLS